MAGSSTVNAPGVYGVPGTASAANTPGARDGAGFWTDASGNFWLFGGSGYDSAASSGVLNDLWKFSAGQWTWVGGSDIVNAIGNYGSLGVAASGNVPGARSAPATWTDSSGNFWMFGGGGYGANLAAGPGFLNDLWEYSAGQWTWVGGPSAVGATGSYGTQGTAVAGNLPMSRNCGTTWTDASGNLWLFGGTAVESTFTSSTTIDLLNDLWRFTP